MVEKTIHSIDELIEFIYRFTSNSQISIGDLERQAGIYIGTLASWKKKTCMPSCYNLINVLSCLDIYFFLKSPKDLQGKSLEKKIHNCNELIEFIFLCIDNTKIGIMELEKTSGLSFGVLSRWQKKSNIPNFYNLLNVLTSLNVEVILKSEVSEEAFVNADIFSCITAIISSDISLDGRKLILSDLNSIIAKIHQ